MGDVIEAKARLDEALELRLRGVERLVSRPLSVLAENWNGAGPEWMKPEVRAKLSKWLAVFKPAFFVHDQDFSDSDGSFHGYNSANDRLEDNCLIIADAKYAFYDPRRYLARRAAPVVADVVRVASWPAWWQAHEKARAKARAAKQKEEQ